MKKKKKKNFCHDKLEKAYILRNVFKVMKKLTRYK
jgi:hypothetical protein